MKNKYLRYFMVEPKCWLRLGILVVLVAVIIAQVCYKGAQAKQITAVQKKVDLVARIPTIEKELKTKAQLEAFRKSSENDTNEVKFSKISGVAMQGDSPSVLIDDQVYGIGDTFGEYEIIKITEQVITLENKQSNAIKHLYVFE